MEYKHTILSGILLLLSVFTYSQEAEHISIDKLGSTISPVTVPVGFLQSDVSGSYWQRSYEKNYYISEFESMKRTTCITYIHSPVFSVRYGLLKFAELRLGIQFSQQIVNYSNSGNIYPLLYYPRDYHTFSWGPIQAGAKVRFLRGNKFIPEAALVIRLSIPTGYYYGHMDYVSPEFKLAFKNTLLAGFDLRYNLGYGWNLYERFEEKYGSYSVSLNYIISKLFTAYGESFGHFDNGRTPIFYTGAGFSFLAAKNVMFDFSGRLGLTDRAFDHSLGMGVSLRLPK